MYTHALKGAYSYEIKLRKTIAGIVAIAALIPCCLGTTAYAAPQSAADTVISAVMPELEEPMPSSQVDAQIAADVKAAISGTAGGLETIPTPNYAEDPDVEIPDGKPTQDGKLYYKIVSKRHRSPAVHRAPLIW